MRNCFTWISNKTTVAFHVVATADIYVVAAFFLSMSMYVTLSLDHTSKWIGSFVLCYFLLSIQASFIAYSTIKQ